MNTNRLRWAMMAGASMSALLIGSQALAQAPAAPAATPTPTPQGGGQGLSEVVVTATRQATSVNRTSLSIAAVTQDTLNRQNIHEAQDLTRIVPGLSIPPAGSGGSTGGTNGLGIFTVRGIQSSAGAATTGVYLDDTSLTRRNNSGVQQNNGAPLPILYDLDRVEVLKGPQGTLYGGSSEGGTVRFITPTPSLTTYSGSMRVEARTVDMGGWGGQFGAAVGGPIVPDKLGFRLSGMWQRDPGYINAYSPYTMQKVASDVNQDDEHVVRGSVLWQATDRFSILGNAYTSEDRTRSQITAPTTIYSPLANGQKAGANTTFTTPAACIDQRSSATFVPYNPGQPANSQPAASPLVPAACNTTLGPTPLASQYQRPSYTYGPFKQGPNIAYLTGQQELTGRVTGLDVFDISLNYNFDKVAIKLISSVVHDTSYSENNGGEDQTQQQTLVGGPISGVSGKGVPDFPLWAGYPDYPGHFIGNSYRDGIEEEFRISSRDPSDRLQYVAGVYYESQRVTNHYSYPDPHFTASLNSFWGPSIGIPQRYGVTQWDGDSATTLNAHLDDRNLSGYADLTYYVLPKLKVEAGVRISQLKFHFDSFDAGPFSSRYPDSVGGAEAGESDATPVTPKFGVTYEITKNDLVYVTAAEGFRSGGVNAPVGPVVCAPGLALYGITATQAPLTYQPDSVWSYEAGGKFRLLDNKMQLNAAYYRIDWSSIQSAITLTCGQGFVLNGGRARSEGFDFQGQYRPIDPLTLSFNLGYDNAYYIDPVSGPLGAGHGPNAINAGDKFAVPPWQLSASAAYDTELFGRDTYLQLDYQWTSGYTQPGSFGVASWNPYVLDVGAVDTFNGRLGVRFTGWDLNVWANNLLNRLEKVGNAGNGISQCVATNQACTNSSLNGNAGFGAFNPFVSQLYTRPREIGLQANYRF
jgi:iron complex outermembrane receptor protein